MYTKFGFKNFEFVSIDAKVQNEEGGLCLNPNIIMLMLMVKTRR
jgi:hypothetical protein